MFLRAVRAHAKYGAVAALAASTAAVTTPARSEPRVYASGKRDNDDKDDEMKHGVAFRKLNRTSEHRWAMLRTMVDQLVTHERIRTTLPKAKELRRVADQVVTLAKQGDEPARKRAQAIMRTPEAVEKLFDVFAPRYKARQGGYTRILKADFRQGDGAEMAVIEYIDRPGEMRKAKPPQGIAAINAAFEAQASQ